MLKTRFTELLGVDYPIQVGTMMHISNAEFVAACANAGVFACLASSMFTDEASLVSELNKIRELTDKPFGVNVSLFPGHDARTVEVTLDILNREKIKIIETAGRSPEPHLERIRQNGAIHLHKCARLRDALKVDRMEVDLIAVVGSECGGHPGMEDIGTSVLVPEVSESIKAPLIAGGGFCDGKGLVAALSLGAEAVLMGSRFLNTLECRIHEEIKQNMVDAGLTDTMIIQRSISSPVRVLKNEWAEKILQMEQDGASFEQLLPKLSGQLSGEAWIVGGKDAVFPCGQVIGRTKDTLSVGELVARIVTEAETVAKRIGSLAGE
ncbi:MAG: nitronate monooxygenase [Proteobacteria bacterium]|nr:nitronate monooxygenase [Pseudomonadota bacterium]